MTLSPWPTSSARPASRRPVDKTHPFRHSLTVFQSTGATSSAPHKRLPTKQPTHFSTRSGSHFCLFNPDEVGVHVAPEGRHIRRCWWSRLSCCSAPQDFSYGGFCCAVALRRPQMGSTRRKRVKTIVNV